MSLVGNPATLSKLAASIRAIPKTLAIRVSAKVAPQISGLARTAFLSGQTVYGDARPSGKYGPVSLQKSGAMFGTLSFVSIGTRVRASLGTRYARFHVGRFRILPMGNMPASWSTAIGDTARAEIGAALGGAR